MKLNELFENTSTDKLAFCFGRLNPPTLGHAHLFEVMADTGNDYKIFVSATQDKKKNPLTYEQKVKFIQEIHPEHATHVVIDQSLNTIIKVAVSLYDQGYKNVVFVAGDDRREIYDMLDKYNGVEGKAHGFYKFDILEFQSAGARDPDADGTEGVSASTARQKALEGDFEGFESVIGAGSYTKELYDAVRARLGIKI
jgi:citrate lyase synthetase